MKLHAIIAFYAGVLFACAEASYVKVPTPLECSDDRECSVDQSCHRGQCLDVKPGVLANVDVEITPPSTALAARTQLLARDLDTNTETELVLPAPTLFGAIQVLGDMGEPIAARLTIRGHDRIPTRETDSILLLDSNRVTGVKLLPGLYDVRVLPTDAAKYPGIEIHDFEVRAGAMVPRRELTVPTRYRTLTGEVTRRTTNQYKIPGVTVQATSIGSGLLSTRATTDQDGRFSILLPETPDTSFVLTAVPAADSLGAPSWSFSQTITFGQSQREIVIPLEETTAEVRGRVRLRVLGVGPDGPIAVAGARVVLSATTGLDYRSFTVQAFTNGEGYLPETPLLSATYRVTVEPPVDSPFQPTETRLELGVLNNNLIVDKQLELAPKTAVRGVVQSSSGQPVASATLLFERATGAPRPVSTTTDGDGSYALALEGGSYVVTISPTSNSRVSEPLPVKTAAVEVPMGDAAFELPPFALDAGTLLRAIVRDASGSPVARADVELFARVAGRPISLGRAISDESGRVSLVVPF